VNTDTIAALRRILVNDLFVEVEESKIGLDDGLQTVVGLDSIGFSELRILIERKFNLVVDDGDFSPDNFSTLRKLDALIARLRAGAAA
jgi:acyl carrier protein